ncbi:MAG TPA: tetratricopeptide repeat protein, partial [Myxococcaceae bacterium]|nr:tetratricopeptide repeat protein [Myxococcaceae bacterium]
RLERRLRAAGPAAISRPARETLARARLRSGRDDKALELAEALVRERPGCGHAWFLLAEAQVARGAFEEAAHAFSSFLECWSEADPHLPELHRARSFLSSREGRGSEGGGRCNLIPLHSLERAAL